MTRPEDLGFAQVDHDRTSRQGVAEVVYGEGKTPAQVAAIGQAILAHGDNLLVTRASREAFLAVKALNPDARFDESGRVIVVERTAPPALGRAAICAAGTSDLYVVDECATCALAFGIEPVRFVDIGVAGIHRTLAAKDAIDACDVVIVVAGMEGALASVVAGLTRKPLIAVPTSVGYGASFGGLAALLAMLNGCASGVVVVNIDNGFGAAMAARRMLQTLQPRAS